MNKEPINFHTKYKSRKGEEVHVLSLKGPDEQHPVVVAYKTPPGEKGLRWRYDSVTAAGNEYVNLEGKNDLIEQPDIVTVRRVLEVTGKRDWVEQTLSKSLVRPEQPFRVPNGTIFEVERTVIE